MYHLKVHSYDKSEAHGEKRIEWEKCAKRVITNERTNNEL